MRRLLTGAVSLFLTAFLAACGGGFFIHPSLSSTYISPATAAIAIGKTAQLTVYGIYSDGSTQQVGGSATSWTSSDPAVATVSSPGGLVTGVSAGTATITATTTATIQGTGCQVVVSISNGTPVLSNVCYGNSTETLTATINVTVMANDVNRAVINTTEGSTVSQSTATVSEAPATLQFYAYANGDAANDLTQSVTWTSSNKSVATITSGLASGNGVATAVAAGTTNITASTTNSAGQVVNSQTIVLTVQ
ncbi:MAG TPA: Ig-like domain-containing protein [Acidobacteriaceae bacterium]|nr:Ig-like domain-containing protein [Acidobacteriaceae bacterium]